MGPLTRYATSNVITGLDDHTTTNTSPGTVTNNMSMLLFAIYVLCSALGLLGMFMVCLIASVMFMKQLQKQGQTLSVSQNLYSEAVNSGPLYETVTNGANPAEQIDILNSADLAQNGISSSETEIATAELERTETLENTTQDSNNNNHDLTNSDHHYQSLQESQRHSNGTTQFEPTTSRLYVYPTFSS